jgi:hypothetical protein
MRGGGGDGLVGVGMDGGLGRGGRGGRKGGRRGRGWVVVVVCHWVVPWRVDGCVDVRDGGGRGRAYSRGPDLEIPVSFLILHCPMHLRSLQGTQPPLHLLFIFSAFYGNLAALWQLHTDISRRQSGCIIKILSGYSMSYPDDDDGSDSRDHDLGGNCTRGRVT